MDNNEFKFKYSAPTNEERKEIESIRNSYLMPKKKMSKLDILRKLDGKVKNFPLIMSLIVGIVGTLIFGLGMAMILEWNIMIWGIVVCIVGATTCGFAYPVFILSTKKMREKYSSQIIKLSDELLNEKED